MTLTLPLIAGPAWGSPVLGQPALETLWQYAGDTWRSLSAMTSPIGLPSDFLTEAGERSRNTSPTNIAALIWSVIAARDLRIIPDGQADRQLDQTLTTLSLLERHADSGQFFNWYDPITGDLLYRWPARGGKIEPFLSSVDNGWLAAALWMVENASPPHAAMARAIRLSMDFHRYYDPQTGLLYGGFWSQPFRYTAHRYGPVNSETRIASYIGIAMGQLPAEHYFKLWRSLPPGFKGYTQRWAQGELHQYLGLPVFEGYCTCRGMRIVPSWGGGMFEGLMVPLFIPEEQWGPESWGINHLRYARAQIEHGLIETHDGAWGYSPASDANHAGGYGEFGVPRLGMSPTPYPSRHTVSPHAVFLTLDFAPQESIQNLTNLQSGYPVYGPWGFWDSVNVRTRQVANRVLALDQGIIMAAIANALTGDLLQSYLSCGEFERSIRPLIEQERFAVQ